MQALTDTADLLRHAIMAGLKIRITIPENGTIICITIATKF